LSDSEGAQISSSASDKSIMILLMTIHVQWLIVNFIKAKANVIVPFALHSGQIKHFEIAPAAGTFFKITWEH
jgi:hypothetical protein